MVSPIRSLAGEEERKRDQERFKDMLSELRDKLHDVESRCLDNDILREAVSVAVDGYCRQLESIERACERTKDRYAPSDSSEESSD